MYKTILISMRVALRCRYIIYINIKIVAVSNELPMHEKHIIY